LSVQSLTKEGQDKGSEAKTLQEAFKQLNAEMQNSPNPMETKEISRFTPVEKVGIEPERTIQENLLKGNDHHDQPVKKTSAKDGNDNFAENPDLKQDGNKSKESKADGLQSAVNYGNISKAYQKGNFAGIASPLPPQKVDVAEFAQRTLQMVKSVPSNGITSAKLILSPPALGSLQIDISLKADHVRMSIKAENQDTLKMIENQIGALRDKLAEHGLKTEKIELTYRNENHEKHLDAGQEKQRRNEEDKKLRRDFLRTFSGNQLSGEELESQLTYIPASGSYLSQRNLTGV
jgi:flagellar hook-length control protein FliK